MSKTVLIVLGILFVILIVAFGHNPVAERHKKKQEALAGQDPLIHAIEEHNKQPAFANMGKSLKGGIFGAPNGQSRGFNNTNSNNSRGNGRGNSQEGMQQQNTPPQNSYYPPAAMPTPDQGQGGGMNQRNNNNQPSSSPDSLNIQPSPSLINQPTIYTHVASGPPVNTKLLPQTLPTKMHLADGTPLMFAGTGAYTTNANGEVVHLADGVYPIFNGKVDMIIRNGKKIMVPSEPEAASNAPPASGSSAASNSAAVSN